MGNMTTRHLRIALLSLSLAVVVYVPACEYDPAKGGSQEQPQNPTTSVKAAESPEAAISNVPS
jgi:hypothetical protein